MQMNIFDDDAFSAVSMTTAMEDTEFKPGLIGSMNLFDDVPISTTHVGVERRGSELALIATSERGAPLPEGNREGRKMRLFETIRIAKGQTLKASEIQNVRAFGTEGELETAVGYIARAANKLVNEVELTWEYQMLGAVQGVVLDADGSVIVDWFAEWNLPDPVVINFALNVDTTDVNAKCEEVIDQMALASKGAWTLGSRVVALCGKKFFAKLTRHKTVKEIYLNSQQVMNLARAGGVATQSQWGAGSFSSFEYGGILFVRYRGTDNFDTDAESGKSSFGVKDEEVKFFPADTPGIFEQAFSPGEAFEFVNTLGRKLYSLLLRDDKRNFWVRPEVYSYPLFICKRPEMLLRGVSQ